LFFVFTETSSTLDALFQFMKLIKQY